MKIGKFNIKNLTQYCADNKLSDVNTNMLIILAKLANEYLSALETEGVLYKYITREGLNRTKKNGLIDNIIPTFSMISKILKDNSLVLPKNTLDNEDDDFNDMMKKLSSNEEE